VRKYANISQINVSVFRGGYRVLVWEGPAGSLWDRSWRLQWGFGVHVAPCNHPWIRPWWFCNTDWLNQFKFRWTM